MLVLQYFFQMPLETSSSKPLYKLKGPIFTALLVASTLSCKMQSVGPSSVLD